MWLLSRIDRRVEARESQCGAHSVGEREDPAVARHTNEAPQKYDQRRRNAERNYIRQRIKLSPKAALAFQHPRNTSVEAVEHARRNNRRQRQLPVATNGEPHGR